MKNFFIYVAAFLVAYLILLFTFWIINGIRRAWQRHVVNPIFMRGVDHGYRLAQQDNRRYLSSRMMSHNGGSSFRNGV